MRRLRISTGAPHVRRQLHARRIGRARSAQGRRQPGAPVHIAQRLRLQKRMPSRPSWCWRTREHSTVFPTGPAVFPPVRARRSPRRPQAAPAPSSPEPLKQRSRPISEQRVGPVDSGAQTSLALGQISISPCERGDRMLHTTGQGHRSQRTQPARGSSIAGGMQSMRLQISSMASRSSLVGSKSTTPRPGAFDE